MNTREKFYAVKNALNDENQLQLFGQSRLEGTVFEVSNLPQILDALDAWASFSWSENPAELRSDIAYLLDLPSVSEDAFQRMQARLQQFSRNQLSQAEPMRVLEDAVSDFGEELFQMEVKLKTTVRETLESAGRAISLPESLIVEGRISEPRFGNGSLEIFWPMAETHVRSLWTLAMYCWQEIKAFLSDPATAHFWSVIDKQPDPETVRNIKRDYIQSTLGADDTLSQACEAVNIDIGEVKTLAMQIASMETTEDVSFQWPLGWRKQKVHRVHGVSVQIRSEQMTIPDNMADAVSDTLESMTAHTASLDIKITQSDDINHSDN